MKNNSNTPAFPTTHSQSGTGLTKHEYACIKLGIPESGDPELDELILKSERKRIASMAMQCLCVNFSQHGHYGNSESFPMVSQIAVQVAIETLAELEKSQQPK